MTHDTSEERQAFESWLGIKPCGAAHDLAWSAWKAARSATSAPKSPVNVWQRAVDNALVSAHLGVAGDVTAEEAAKALHDLICWNIEVATDPKTNGGKVLVPVDVIAANKPAAQVPQGWKPVPVELLERIQESLGSFVSDQGWSQSDMDTADALDGLLAAAPRPPVAAPVELPEPDFYVRHSVAAYELPWAVCGSMVDGRKAAYLGDTVRDLLAAHVTGKDKA